MKTFFAFWTECAVIAAKGTVSFANNWQWLFGVPIVSGLLRYLTTGAHGAGLSAGDPILDGLLAALMAFFATWALAFFIRLINAPVTLNYRKTRELGRLAKLAGEIPLSSFELTIEAIGRDDADSSSLYSEYFFRVAIKNCDLRKTFEAYCVLEAIVPSLGVSPAARLPAMGRGGDARTLSIAPSETAYVLLLEKRKEHNAFLPSEFGGGVEFSASSSAEDVWSRVVSDLSRRENGLGVLKVGVDYLVTLAVHAPGP